MVSLDTPEIAISASILVLLLVGITYVSYAAKQRRYKRIISGAYEEGAGTIDEKNYTISGNLVKEISNVPIISAYSFQDVLLGRGSSAHVVIGVHRKTQRRYAIKIIDTNAKNIAWKYMRELKMMKDTDHTNIVRVYEMYHKPATLYFVMELCTGGHLGQVLKQNGGVLEVGVARQYISQLTSAIAHCHHLGITHRDVKLQNILLESSNKDAQIKLVDFGNSARFTQASLPFRKIVGTTYTAAPEVFKQEYDERCDVWSMGVVTYILLSGHRPFEPVDMPTEQRSRESSIIANILLGRYHFLHESWETISDVAIHYIKCCLELDYTRRRTAEECLHHPWLADNLHEDFAKANGQNSISISTRRARKLSIALSRNLSSSGIRRTTMLGVAFMMPSNKVQTLRNIFQSMDTHGRGYINLEEFRTAMNMMNPGIVIDEVDLMFYAMDSNLSGQISFTEFVAASLDPREVNIAELNRVFRLFDQDSKGYINEADLRRVLETEIKLEDDTGAVLKSASSLDDSGRNGNAGTGIQQTDFREKRQEELRAKIANIIGQSDLDKDGVISYTEFLFIMADSGTKKTTATNEKPNWSTGKQNKQQIPVRSASINYDVVPAKDQKNVFQKDIGEGHEGRIEAGISAFNTMTDSGSAEEEADTMPNLRTMEEGAVRTSQTASNPEFEEKRKRRQSDSGVDVFGKQFSFRRSSMMFTALPSFSGSSWFGRTPSSEPEVKVTTNTKGSFGARYSLTERYDPNLRQMQGSNVNKNVINKFLMRGSSNDLSRQDISEEKSRDDDRHVPSIMQLIWMDVKSTASSLYGRFGGAPAPSMGGIKGVNAKVLDTEVQDESVSSSDSDDDNEDTESGSAWSTRSHRRVSSPAMMWQTFKRRASVTFGAAAHEPEKGKVAVVVEPSRDVLSGVKHIVHDILQSQPTEKKLLRRGSSQRRASAIQFKHDNDGIADMGGMINDMDQDAGVITMPRELRAELGLEDTDDMMISVEQKAFETIRSTSPHPVRVKGHLKKTGSKDKEPIQQDSSGGNSTKDNSALSSDSNENSNGWGGANNSMDVDDNGSSLSENSTGLKELVAIIKKQQHMNASAGFETPVLTPEDALSIANRLLENAKVGLADASPSSIDSELNSSYLERMNQKSMKTIYEQGSIKPAGLTEAVFDAFQKGVQIGRSQGVAPELQRNEVDVEKKVSAAVDRRSARRASFNG